MERIRVLMVDDDDTVFETVRRRLALLDSHEVEMERAVQVEEALDRLRSFRPHVVILDNYLAGEPHNSLQTGSGWSKLLPELAAAHAQGESEMPVTLCFTGHRKNAREIMEATGWGAADFIDKTDVDALDRLEHAVVTAYDTWKSQQAEKGW